MNTPDILTTGGADTNFNKYFKVFDVTFQTLSH